MSSRQRCAERIDGRGEPAEADLIFPPTDLKRHPSFVEINGAINLRVRLVHAPDLVDGPGGVQQRDRRIKLERELGDIVRRQATQLGRFEGHPYLSVQGRIQGPFKTGHVRQVLEVATRRKSCQEGRKVRAILEQTRRYGRILAYVGVSRIAEKPFVHQTTNDWEGRL